MNARYYDASLGRFISSDSIIPDPMNPQSLNRYSYVLNNPVSFNDPTGHGFFGASLSIGDPGAHIYTAWLHPYRDAGPQDGPGEEDDSIVGSEQAASGSARLIQDQQLQCPMCEEGFPSGESERPILEWLTGTSSAWLTLDEYLSLVPKDESALIVNGSFAVFKVFGGVGYLAKGDTGEGVVQTAVGAFELLKSALTTFGFEGIAEVLERGNPFVTAIESYYDIAKIDESMNTEYYGPGNTPWEQHGESYLWHQLRYFLMLENPAPTPPPGQQ